MRRSVLAVFGLWQRKQAKNCVVLSNRKTSKSKLTFQTEERGSVYWDLFLNFLFYDLCISWGDSEHHWENMGTYPKSCEPQFINLNNKMFHESESKWHFL